MKAKLGIQVTGLSTDYVFIRNEQIYKCYKSLYTMLAAQVELLNFAIEQDNTYYIKQNVQRTIEETRQLDGYVECLFDLGYFSEVDFDKLWSFTNLIRLECIELI